MLLAVQGSGHGHTARVMKKRRSSTSTGTPPSVPARASAYMQNAHSMVHHAEPPGKPYLEP